MDPEILIPLVAVPLVLLGLPWIIFHYVTKWKRTATLTQADEQLLDDLYDAARRLDDRLCTIERILTAENPDWRQQCLASRGDRLLEEQPQRMFAQRETR
jgi:phage shock protein B